MLRKIREEEIRSIAVLANTPDLQRIKNWLADSRSDAAKVMLNGDSDFIRDKAAGSYETLDTIIDAIDHCREMNRDVESRQHKIQKPKNIGAY